MTWREPPETVTWTLKTPLSHGGTAYTAITMRAPTTGQIMKATAVPGRSGVEVTLRLIEDISGVPYDALLTLPSWVTEQVSRYMDSFAGAPMPYPLDEDEDATPGAIAS